MPTPESAASEVVYHRPQFQTTHWSVVLAAGQAPSGEAHAALEKLCRAYWYPLYAFVRREGHSADEAQDLTQAFFARLLERRDFEHAQKERGRLRSFLLVSLKHFLVNEWQRARAQKRGGDQVFVPLDEILAEERFGLEPADSLTAERIYERRWALTILDQVFERLRAEYAAAGKSLLYERLKSFLGDHNEAPTQAELATALGMTENAVKQALFRFRQRYRDLLRAEIGNTVESAAEVENEWRYLVTVLRQ
jgi:RNA polymerase sigma factor (sigma-70 family)